MLHARIESEEMIERYARNQLSPDERQAFEEHFFACDECFEKLQATERFIAGMRDAGARGLLGGEEKAAAPLAAGAWLRWALAASACAAVTFGALAAWMYFSRIPALQRDLKSTSAQARIEGQTPAQLGRRPGARDLAEANVPLVILQASRGRETAVADLPPGASQLVVWIEIGPTRFRSFRIDIYSHENKLAASVDNLKPGPYGALAASFPASRLPAGDFRVTLVGQNPPPASLVGDYRMQIRKP